MSRLDVQFLDQGMHRVMFDAMPIPVFVVDRDVTILDYNSAAAQMLEVDKTKVVRRRAGEVLHCLHASETKDGCGRSWFCSDCAVRNSVRAAWQGTKVVRQTVTLDVVSGGKPRKVNVRVSTSPFHFNQHSYVLLILEGLNDQPYLFSVP